MKWATAVFTVLGALLLSCDTTKSSDEDGIRIDSASSGAIEELEEQTALIPSKQEQIAYSYFLEQWELTFLKCGEAYFGCFHCQSNPPSSGSLMPFMSANKILEIRTSPSAWLFEPYELSEADRANNIKWYGDLTVGATMSALYDIETRDWSQYWDGTRAFWMMTDWSGGQDVPIIFQVVEYQGGSHGLFFSNQYTGAVSQGLYNFLMHAWKTGIEPLDSCDSVPGR